MAAFACCRSAQLALVVLSLAQSSKAEPESGAVLTCLLADTEPLPNERWVSSRSGRESRLGLSWSRQDRGLLPGLETSARLRLELGLDALRSGTHLALRDGSSWLRLDFSGVRAGQLSLTAFPFDTDYERLGYVHALDWGGTDAARGESIFVGQQGGVPGLELSYAASRVELHAGLRWATSQGPTGSRRLWGALVRGGLKVAAALRVDFGLGYFEREGVALGAAAPSGGFVEGATLRLVWHGQSATEPELTAEPFRAPELRDADQLLLAPETRGTSLALEGVALATRLRQFEQPGQSRLSLAPAAALYGSSRGSWLAFNAAVSWRSLAFVQRNGLGLMRGETAPAGAVEHAELAAWVGVSAMSAIGLGASLQAGVALPAALEMASALPGFSQSIVVLDDGAAVALPIGSARLPLAAGRVALRFSASPSLSFAIYGDYERDPNRVQPLSAAGGARRVFAEPERIGAGAAARASF